MFPYPSVCGAVPVRRSSVFDSFFNSAIYIVYNVFISKEGFDETNRRSITRRLIFIYKYAKRRCG